MYLCGKRYKVIKRLGEGGFGCVYLAEDTLLGNTWAIKEAGSCDKISYAVVKAEISVLSKVSHPGIVRITDVFKSDGHIYIVMDHVKGMNLMEIMRLKKKIQEKILFRWFTELCDAVSYLHHMDPPVILRDIKPQNIMVRPNGHIVLIDFGAAVYENAENAPQIGSRKYAAPEQTEDGRADVRSDIYAIGKVIDAVTDKDKAFGIKSVVRRCTMKDARLRYRSVNAVKRDIILLRNIWKIMLGAAAVLTAGILIICSAKNRTEEINETAAARQSYEQGLLCFYELDDYKAAERYLEKVPEEAYPEKKYYMELTEMLSGETAGERPQSVIDVLESFEAYNESTVKNDDEDRYIKNNFCIAKTYIASCPGESGYEKAYDLAERVLKLSEGKDAGSGGYKEDSLKFMINISILEGRTEGSDMSGKYHRAVRLIDELTGLPDVRSDRSCVIEKRMDEAALYTELKEYDSAIGIYEKTEAEYPYDPGINYLAHLSLLIQSGADDASIRMLWDSIQQVDGIESSADYQVMEERIQELKSYD